MSATVVTRVSLWPRPSCRRRKAPRGKRLNIDTERMILRSARRLHFGDLMPTPVVTAAGHSQAYEVTAASIRSVLGKVPITRVFDITPLDRIGVPVWSAVTPLAQDLTVHTGKGLSHLSSRLSAVMEAIERVSAEGLEEDLVFSESYKSLGNSCRLIRPLDPELFQLPFKTSYQPDTPITWTIGFDLLAQHHCFVPRDVIVSPARNEICLGPETNGLASGGTFTEAVVHALYEVIERDAVSVEEFCALHTDADDQLRPPLRLIDPATLPDFVRQIARRIMDAGIDVRIQDVTSTAGVPAYCAFLIDRPRRRFEGSDLIFEGSGADLDASRAVTRAIIEAAQAHTAFFAGARDTFEGMQQRKPRLATRRRYASIIAGTDAKPFRGESFASDDLLQDLGLLLERIMADGLQHCVVADLTDALLHVPTVRVVVPGLAGGYGQTRRRPTPRLLRHLIPYLQSDVRRLS